MTVVQFRFPKDDEFSFPHWKEFLLHIALGATVNTAAAECGAENSTQASDFSKEVKQRFNVGSVDAAVALAAGKRIIVPSAAEQERWRRIRFDALGEHHVVVVSFTAMNYGKPEISRILHSWNRNHVDKTIGDAYMRLDAIGKRAKAFARLFWNGPATLVRPLHELSYLEEQLVEHLAKGSDLLSAGRKCLPRLTAYGTKVVLANALYKTDSTNIAQLVAKRK